MDKKDKKRQSNKKEFLDDTINLVIRIGMKKIEVKNSNSNTVWERSNANQTSSSNDTNNNESTNNQNSVMKVKKDLPSLAMSVKNLFNKSSSSSSSNGDKNNNPVVAPITNQYTKVSVEGLASFQQQLTLNDTQRPQGILNNGNNTGINNQTDPNSSRR
jgi:hypothetical protein